MDNYDCEIVQTKGYGKNEQNEFHLRIRWNSKTDIVDGSTIFWEPRNKGFVRVRGDGEHLVISVAVRESLERNILLLKDNVNISPLNDSDKNLKGKFRFSIEKIDGRKEVVEKHFSVSEIPVEFSLI